MEKNVEDGTVPRSCSVLKDALSISDLIDSGTTFEINTNCDDGFDTELFEELNLGSDHEDEDAAELVDRRALASPWMESFAELKKQMEQVSEHIHKKITHHGQEAEGPVPLKARVCIRYNAYWEGEGAPFDSSILRGSAHHFYTGRNEVIEGLEAAVLTMHRGEQAQFVISYHLLFREMGCPPRIKPCADALFIIELVTFNEVGDVDADQQLAEEDRGKYAVVVEKVKEIHLKGLDFFGQGLHTNACRAFEKAVNVLNACRLANEEEQSEQTAFLLKLYTNLAVCYNKINRPAQTCLMCKEIRRLTGNRPSCKALFQEGRALLTLGEYERARNILTRAQRMEPQNDAISKELTTLEQRYARYTENERSIWTKAMGVMQRQQPAKLKEKSATHAPESEFEQEMFELLKKFKENFETNSFKLPSGLTEKEIETVGTLARRMDMTLSLSPLDNTTYTLSKT